MEKRKSNRLLSRSEGVIEFDIDNPDSIDGRKKHSWKRFSFVGFMLMVVIVLVVYFGHPPPSHHLKHDIFEPQAEPTEMEHLISPHIITENPPETITAPNAMVTLPSETLSLDIMEQQCVGQIDQIREMKRNGVVIENDVVAKEAVAKLQECLRKYLVQKYGPEPYYVEMKLSFPTSMPDYETNGPDGTLFIELAPLSAVPYCVYNFLQIVKDWEGGNFHRNAGHVLQAMVKHNGPGLAFQEYSPTFPHAKHTLGYAGRPGGPAFYISTLDNTYNHGPASQGSKTEADGIFGKIVPMSGGEKIIARMQKQPGVTKPAGFIDRTANYIHIDSLRLIGKSDLPPSNAPH